MKLYNELAAGVRLSELTNQQLIAMSQQATNNLSSHIEQTPLVPLAMLDQQGWLKIIYAKDETQQPGHTFKIRGADVAIGQYALQGARSVVTSSAGNHGQEVARAGKHYGLPVKVFVPSSAENVKKQTMADFGADVVEVDGDFSVSKVFGLKDAEQTGAQFVDPFADPLVMAGQGTLAFELYKQLPNVTRVVLPVGGMGLLTGFGSVMKALKPDVEIVGVQPSGANTFVRSMQTGKLTSTETSDSRFGGLAVRELDPRVFALGCNVTDYALQVGNDEVFRTVHQLCGIFDGKLFEAAGATGVAGCLQLDETVGSVTATVLTGSNASPEFGDFVNKLAVEHGWNHDGAIIDQSRLTAVGEHSSKRT